MKKLSENEIQIYLENELPNWTHIGNKLQRTFTTANWQATLMVSNAIAFIAESVWHHPELILNYNSVKINLNTHDINGITLKDIELAQLVDSIVIWKPSKKSLLTGNPEEWIKDGENSRE